MCCFRIHRRSWLTMNKENWNALALTHAQNKRHRLLQCLVIHDVRRVCVLKSKDTGVAAVNHVYYHYVSLMITGGSPNLRAELAWFFAARNLGYKVGFSRWCITSDVSAVIIDLVFSVGSATNTLFVPNALLRLVSTSTTNICTHIPARIITWRGRVWERD